MCEKDFRSSSIVKNLCNRKQDRYPHLAAMSRRICIVGEKIALQIQLGRAIRWLAISGDPLNESTTAQRDIRLSGPDMIWDTSQRRPVGYDHKSVVRSKGGVLTRVFGSPGLKFLGFLSFSFFFLAAARQRTQICWSPRDKRSLGSRSPKAVRRLVGRTTDHWLRSHGKRVSIWTMPMAGP